MTTFRILWAIHKWLGITLGAILVVTAASGLLLLLKKDYAWLQPPTARGAEGSLEQIAPMHDVLGAVFALGLPQFQDASDIDRVDFRPAHRVFKVLSRHEDLEVQVDAITLHTHAPALRRSDWLERIHDGRWLGEFAHGRVYPIAALGLIALTISGYAVWLWPKWLKRRTRRRAVSRA